MISNSYFHQKVIHALLLATGSSTDNFCVGFSHGIKSNTDKFWDRQFFYLNLIISYCNALGAACAGYLSLFVFDVTSDRLNTSYVTKNIVSLLSGMAFHYLSYNELFSQSSVDDKHDHFHVDSMRTTNDLYGVMKLAIPMTLNNLTGGVIGGLSGIDWLNSMFFSFFSSFVLMSAGYSLSKIRLLRHYPGLLTHAHILSGIIFGILGNEQLIDYYYHTYCS